MKLSEKLKGISFAALFFVLGASAFLTGCNGSGAGQSNDPILGAGSTFVYPLFSKMFTEYSSSTGIKVNYQAIGSGAGVEQLVKKTVDFAGSDAPLSDKQDSAIGVPMLHIPIAAGANVVSYNVPGLKDTLKLTPDVIADIFLGKITTWNDPKIAAINSGVNLPAAAIVVAHRLDASGTTYIWTDYLSKVSEEWKSKVGKGTSVNWPLGTGANGNDGVAGLIKQTSGAIGYIELAYAVQNNMAYAKVQNKSGNFILPTLSSITAAGFVALPSDTKVSITNTDAADGYPISSFTWAVIYKEQNYNGRSKDRATALIKQLWWDIHEGQQYCAPLNYAPLSGPAQLIGSAVLRSANYDGKPILPEAKEDNPNPSVAN